VWHSFRFLRSKPDVALGIDISSTSIRLLALSRQGEQHCIEDYACVALAVGAVQHGVIYQIDCVAQALQAALKQMRVSSKEAIICIPDSCTINKQIQVSDRIQPQDLDELVLIEIDKHIPYPIEEINYDYHVLGSSPTQPGMYDVFMVASRTDYINHRVQALQLAGLSTQCVDLESLAIQRAMQTSWMDAQQNTILVLDIGIMHLKSLVLHKMTIIFMHEISRVGDDDFGRNHSNQRLGSVDNSSSIESTSTFSTQSPPTFRGLSAESKIAMGCQQLIALQHQLLSQINQILQFFHSSHATKSIDQIILLGDGAKQTDLVAFLTEQLGISIHRANPFVSMHVAKQVDYDAVMDDAPLYMLACGLALRA